MSDTSQGPGWWLASDGKWYPPESAPGSSPPLRSDSPDTSEEDLSRGISDRKRAQLIADAAPALHDGEEVLDLTTGVAHVRRMGTKTTRRATILVTDRRVLVFSKKMGGYDVQDYAYGLLTGVDYKKGMTSGHIDLRAAGDSANVQQVRKLDVQRIAEAIRHKMAAAHPHSGNATATPAPSSDFAEELRKLASLRDDGLLTEEEFQERRKKLLDS